MGLLPQPRPTSEVLLNNHVPDRTCLIIWTQDRPQNIVACRIAQLPAGLCAIVQIPQEGEANNARCLHHINRLAGEIGLVGKGVIKGKAEPIAGISTSL